MTEHLGGCIDVGWTPSTIDNYSRSVGRFPLCVSHLQVLNFIFTFIQCHLVFSSQLHSLTELTSGPDFSSQQHNLIVS